MPGMNPVSVPGKPMPQRIGTMENMPGALPGRPMPTSTGGFMAPPGGGSGMSIPGLSANAYMPPSTTGQSGGMIGIRSTAQGNPGAASMPTGIPAGVSAQQMQQVAQMQNRANPSGMMTFGGIGGSMPGARPMPTGQMPTAPQGSPMPQSPNVFMQFLPPGTSVGQPMTGQSPMVNPPAPLSTMGGFNDLRGNTIGMGGVSGPNFGDANGYYNRAGAAAGGASIAGVGNVAGPNFGQAQGYMNQAAGNIGGVQTKNYGSIAAQNGQPTLSALQGALQQSNSPMSDQLRQMGMTSLQGLSSAPDRAQLAAQALQLQRTMTEPQFQQDMRAWGRRPQRLVAPERG
jgi:hypothetical protein